MTQTKNYLIFQVKKQDALKKILVNIVPLIEKNQQLNETAQNFYLENTNKIEKEFFEVQLFIGSKFVSLKFTAME